MAEASRPGAKIGGHWCKDRWSLVHRSVVTGAKIGGHWCIDRWSLVHRSVVTGA